LRSSGKKIDHLIVATTTKEQDNSIFNLVNGYHKNLSAFRGSENDVLDCYYQAAKQFTKGEHEANH